MIESIGNLFTLTALAIFGYYLVRRRAPILGRRLVDLFMVSAPAAPSVQQGPERSNDVQPRSGQQDAENVSVQRSNVQDEPGAFEPPTVEELRQLAQAIRHNAQGATKQAAIEAAFEVRKGGSAGWRRASQLFDAALGLDRAT